MNDERLADLLEKLGSGSLEGPEEQELAEGLAASTEARTETARQLFLDRVMREMARPKPDAARLMAALPATDRAAPVMRAISRVSEERTRRRRWQTATVGLALAAGVLLGLGVQRRSSLPEPIVQVPPIAEPVTEPSLPRTPAPSAPAFAIEESRGQVYLLSGGERIAAIAGTRLPAGASLSTEGLTSGARVQGPGFGVTLGPDSALAALGPRQVFLSRGQAVLRAEAGAPGVLFTPHLTLSAADATATVTVGSRTTRVQADTGRLQFTRNRGGVTATLETGRFALVSDDGVKGTAEDQAVMIVGPDEQPRGGPPALHAADQAIKERLESFGLRVRIADTRQPMPTDLEEPGVRLVVISSSIVGPSFKWNLRKLHTPILTWEPALFSKLGMVQLGETDQGHVRDSNQILIRDTAHPLAAGFRDIVTVVPNAMAMTRGTPSPLASWVATSPSDPTKAVIFAYDKDVQMPDGPAPARRVGLFLYERMALSLTPEGWALVDAAIRWSIEMR